MYSVSKSPRTNITTRLITISLFSGEVKMSHTARIYFLQVRNLNAKKKTSVSQRIQKVGSFVHSRSRPTCFIPFLMYLRILIEI